MRCFGDRKVFSDVVSLLAHDQPKIIEGRAGSVYPSRNFADNLKLPVASTSDRTNSNRSRM